MGGEGQPGDARLVYLFGVVPGGQALPARSAAPLETVPSASLVGVVELVPAAEFSQDSLDHRLHCADWVAALARRHAAVLEDAMRHGPVVPARLCTLFTSAGALARSLAEDEPRLKGLLEWLKDRDELGLKLFCDEDRLRASIAARDTEAQALETAAASASPGRAYALRKKRDRVVTEAASGRIEEVAHEVLDALEPLAVDSRLRALLPEAVTGRREAMVLNAALLVNATSGAALRAAAMELSPRLAGEGFAIEVTGPWPTYSFCGEGDRGEYGTGRGSGVTR